MDTKKGIDQEKIIDIHLTRGVVVVLSGLLLVLVLSGFLVWTQREAAAANRNEATIQFSALRSFYLTVNAQSAIESLNACASGYHMASLWEIADTTALQYNAALGLQLPDAGSGPVSGYYGWVRTGYHGSSSTIAGHANCYGWTTADGLSLGTRVRLSTGWASAAQTVSPWEADAEPCSAGTTRVWCVED